MRRLALATLALATCVSSGSVHAESQSPLSVRCEWTAPTEGSLVVLWELQIREIIPPADTLTYTFPADPDDPDQGAPHGSPQEFVVPEGDLLRDTPYLGRIRGFDLQGRASPWTPWTDAWFPTPPPDPDEEPEVPGGG